MKKVSIIIVTYNAKAYIDRTLKTLKRTSYPNYEVIIYDNGSNNSTVNYLKKMKEKKKYFDKLILSPSNFLFIGGNNRAFEYVSGDSDLVLLLNPDVEIRNSDWLTALVQQHQKGISACSCMDYTHYRPDGWCFMIDTDLYDSYKMNEKLYKVYYGVADLTARIVNAGYSCHTIEKYNSFIWHFGGASGPFNVVANDKETFWKNNQWSRTCSLVKEININPKCKLYLSKSFYLYYFFDKVVGKIKKVKNKN